MSRNIDEKVVSMQFDNSRFEKNVSTSISTLDKLKKSLNLEGASKGLESVDEASRRCDFSALGNGIETVKAKFSALQVMGITALSNITNQAVNAGKKLVSAFTIEPVKAGFQEYETQMGAVQTILANTQKEGTNVKTVNKALDELNTYADKTIYNFTEMTRNIGTFTAAGVKLDTSVSAIKGIANLAAVSGSTSQQASTAMYQLSQALASGSVKLQDWNSVVNAGMGGQVFQDALKRTSEHLGTGAEAAIKAKGSFRESLREGWLTTEVLTQTLDQFATAADTQEEYQAAVAKFVKQGYSKEQAKEMADMARTAGEAATKVKTFTQLMDTLKEAAGSGWTTTWRLIIGDFEEAKGLWTNISDRLSEMINSSSDARNELVEGLAKGGGRDMLIDSLENSFEGLLSIIKPIKEAFREIFPVTTSKQLINFTKRLKDLTAKLKLSSETADKVKRIFKGVFSIFDLGKKAITALLKPLFDLSQSKGISSLGDFILDIAASIGDFFTALNSGTKTGDFFSSISTTLSKAFGGISNIFESATSGLRNFGDVLSKVWEWITKAFNWISKVAVKIGDAISSAFSWITENVSIGDVFAGLVGGGILVSLKKFSGLLDKIKDVIDSIFGNKNESKEGIGDKFKNILDQVHSALESFTTGLKIASLVSIAIAVGILVKSIDTLSKLDSKDITESIGTIGAAMAELCLTFKSVTKTLQKNGSVGIIKAGGALILMAYAVKVLAEPIEKLSKLSLKEIGKGLVGVGGGIGELCAGIKLIGKTNEISLKTSVAMLALAKSCKLLADALQKFSTLSWGEIGRGLTAMGGALGEFVGSLSILNKFSGGNSIKGVFAMYIAVKSLDDMAYALQDFATMQWDEIGRGLTAMGGALGELTAALSILGKVAGFSSIFAGGAIWEVVQCLDDMAYALQDFATMQWDEIGRGLTAMGGALGEVSVAAGALGKLAGLSGVVGSGTILLTIQGLGDLGDALKSVAELSWDEVGRGLTAMGGALLEVGGISGGLGKLAGLSGLIGSGTILATIQGLDELAVAFQKFGSMSWEEIGRGLVAMGGALLEVGGISGGLGYLAGFAGVIGAGTIWVAVQGLDDLAVAFQKFGSMSWEEIGRGLVAMGGALLEVGGISGGLGALAGIAGVIGAGTIWVAVQGLDDLANALQKFGSMSWEEIGRGLSAMGGALGELALGGLLNTLSGLGAMSIATVAEPLGVLADSVKKWSDVTVPEDLGKQIGSLAWGITKFTFGGSGASAIAEVAAPLGTMADSVKKWSDVTVPEDLGTNMGALADGVKKFTFGGMGAGALSEAAAPLGTMADSVKKWAGVTVSETLGEDLSSLAKGVKAFSFAFAGGWSISEVNEPLGDLAGTVKKWAKVTIPETLGEQLTSLADGVKSFSFAFAAGWSIDTVVEPLGALVDTVKKWAGVTVPDNFGDNLKKISDGIKEFSLLDAAKIAAIDGPLKTLSDAFKNFSAITTTGKSLVTFAKNIKSCSTELSGIDSSAISTASSDVKTLVSVIKKVNGTSVGNVTAFVDAANKLNKIDIGDIKVNTDSLSSAISAIKDTMSSISKSISSSKTSIDSAMKKAISGMSGAVKSQKSAVTSAGKDLAKALEKAIKDKKSSIKSTCKSLITDSVKGIKNKVSSFESAGKDLGNGLVKGIKAKQQAAYDAGYALGQKAVQGEKDGQKSNSPSKLTIQAGKWLGEGLVIGMRNLTNRVYNSGHDLGETAVDSMSSTISNIADIVNSDIDAQPTIRPVLDLSDVTSGANSISSMLDMSPSVGVLSNVRAVSSMMSKRQNGTNDDVVSALNDLKKTINNSSGNTYSINGITYDDGSNVADAIQTLVRAARIERRV